MLHVGKKVLAPILCAFVSKEIPEEKPNSELVVFVNIDPLIKWVIECDICDGSLVRHNMFRS